MATKRSFFKVKFNKSLFSRIIFFLLTLLVVGFLGYRFRSSFLGGAVNGEPIFRFQLTSRLYSSYGRQVLENLIVEKLILQEAKKRKVSVSPEELAQAVEKIKDQLGEEADLDSILALQGVKKSYFENELKVQILVGKLLESEVTVSEEEIANFIKENKELLQATGEAELNLEARQKLISRKTAERLNPWISDLVENAKILRFIK